MSGGVKNEFVFTGGKKESKTCSLIKILWGTLQEGNIGEGVIMGVLRPAVKRFRNGMEIPLDFNFACSENLFYLVAFLLIAVGSHSEFKDI